MTRNVAGDTQTEIAKDVVAPFFIAKLEFASGDAFLSSGPTITYNSDSYTEGTLEVQALQWDETGVQSAKIRMHDYAGSAITLALNNTVADTPVTIWAVYRTPGGYATPTMLAKGYLNPAGIDEDGVNLEVTTVKIDNEFFPARYCTEAEGFNHLPREGSTIRWQGDVYELVRD